MKKQSLDAEVRAAADADRYRKEQEAQAALYQRQKDAEAVRYEQEQAAEAAKKAAEAARFAKEQEAAGMIAQCTSSSDVRLVMNTNTMPSCCVAIMTPVR